MSEKVERPDDVDGDSDGRTRRETLLALGGTMVGAAGYGYGVRPSRSEALHEGSDRERSVPADHVETMTALAAAVYPSSVSVDESFIEDRVFGRTEPRPGHMDELHASIETLDEYATARFGDRIPDLSPERRRAVLRSMGVTESHPDRRGTRAERIRFYLLNDLVFALLTSPMSSDLTGIENPPGHPGGREAYRRAPEGVRSDE